MTSTTTSLDRVIEFIRQNDLQPEKTIEELHLAGYTSIRKAPNHRGSHALKELMANALAVSFPIVVAWQYNEFPSPEDYLEV